MTHGMKSRSSIPRGKKEKRRVHGNPNVPEFLPQTVLIGCWHSWNTRELINGHP